MLEGLRGQAIDVRVLFLTADDNVILRRYNETRRRHPLATAEVSLLDAIRLERKLLKPVADLADVPLDTTHLNLYDLRAAVDVHLPEPGIRGLSVLFLSFGFKNGGPEGADFVFDARLLPNPHWVPDLRALTGRDAPVIDWFRSQRVVESFFDDTRAYLDRWLDGSRGPGPRLCHRGDRLHRRPAPLGLSGRTHEAGVRGPLPADRGPPPGTRHMSARR